MSQEALIKKHVMVWMEKGFEKIFFFKDGMPSPTHLMRDIEMVSLDGNNREIYPVIDCLPLQDGEDDNLTVLLPPINFL